MNQLRHGGVGLEKLSLAASVIALLGAAGPSVAEENPFAAFKLLGEATECVVARLQRTAEPEVAGEHIDASGGERLSDNEANTAYACAREQMYRAYSKSRVQVVAGYRAWVKFSKSPYRSDTHGNRYVNNYANQIAEQAYGRYEQAGTLPEGSLLAKDSFVVDAGGRVIIGALSLMEKMYSGYNPIFNDWRYVLILPDGNVFMSTGGVQSASVEFCGACHRASDAQDSLFFVPEKYRVHGGTR